MSAEQTIFIGWDSRAKVAYEVARFSIMRRITSGKTTKCYPLKLGSLRKNGVLTRPIERKDGGLWCPISEAPMATEFAISRFAVRHIQKRGWALFVDCDILACADISELFALADPRYAVMVVKHDLPATQEGTRKMDGQIQTNYSRKNWSSVVLWNCDHPGNRALTKEVLNTWPGRDLHAFKWLKDEEIGSLPPEWNHLVDIDVLLTEPKIAHLTLGGPWFNEWKAGSGSCDARWLAESKYMVVGD